MTSGEIVYTPERIHDEAARYMGGWRILNGLACLVCRREDGEMVPCGNSRDGVQVFRHPDCELDKGAKP